MGHDLYIQARIKEKRTERVISRGDSDDYAAEDDIGFLIYAGGEEARNVM